MLALLFGTLLTALVQFSSVVSGLSMLAVSQGIVAPQVALVHTVFNLAAAIAALLLMPHAWQPLNPWLKKVL